MNNHVTLIGHVGAEPEVKVFDGGKKLARFSLAVKEMPGSDKERTIWFQIEGWEKNADRIEKAISRGREVVVNGRLSVSSYISKQKDGTEMKVERPVIKLDTFHLCGRKPAEAGASEDAVTAETAEALDTEAKSKAKRSVA